MFYKSAKGTFVSQKLHTISTHGSSNLHTSLTTLSLQVYTYNLLDWDFIDGGVWGFGDAKQEEVLVTFRALK